MKEKERIKVVILAPGEAASVRRIPNTLEAMQKVVGGYIETVTVARDLIIVCNEDGRAMNLAPNCILFGHAFVGTVFLAGRDRGEFCDIPDEAIEYLRVICAIKKDEKQEEETAEWEQVKIVGGIVFRCSSCRRFRFHNGEMRRKFKFCPNCGKRMKIRGGGDG